MHSTAPPHLSADEIDDLLCFTRVNEAQDLRQLVLELAQKYQCQQKDILAACVDPESENTMLHYCAANGFSDLLPALLTYTSSSTSNATNGTPTSPSADAVIINRGNLQGNTPLHWAAYNGHLPVVKLLVAAGADLWIKNKAGHLAMFEAERADKGEVVQYLLEAGGAEVEKTGTEKQPTTEDIKDVTDGEEVPAETSTSAVRDGQQGADFTMGG